MKYLKATPVLASALLCGCVAMYTPPKDGDSTAEIAIELSYATLFRYFSKGDDCSLQQAIPSKNNPLKQSYPAPLKLQAGQEVAFQAGYITGSGYPTTLHVCRLIVSFTPEERKQYKFVYEGGEDGCKANILEKTDKNGYVMAQSAKLRTERLPFFEDGSFCLPN